jgi:MFS family permease
MAQQLWLFYVAGALMGVGFAGGSLAWNLGHQDFASPEQDGLYMSVHVTLNGIRGVISPFLAVGLYNWLAVSGHESWAFFGCFLVNVVGALGFVRHWRDMRRREAAGAFERAGRQASIDEEAPMGRIQASIDRGD